MKHLLALFTCFAIQSVALDLTALQDYYNKALKEWDTPGFAIVIVENGQVVLARGFGVRELGKPERVDEHTLFAIASNTKAFTSAALAMLVDKQRLRWDDRVRQHLPYFEIFENPWISSEARIDDLLCHRLGFKTFSGDLLWWGTPYDSEDVVKRARFLKPQFGLRRGYGYSNIMFIAAGEVLRAVSGQSWKDFVQTELLNPLRMANTVLAVGELAGRTNVASPHGSDQGKPFPTPWVGWDNVAAAGGIISCAADLGKWLRLQLNLGTLEGKTFYGEDQAWKMWALHNSIPGDKKARENLPEFSLGGAALGWFVYDYRGEMILRHGGGYDGMFSETMMAPKKKSGVVVLSNGMTGLARSLAQYSLDALLAKGSRDWSAENLKKDREELAKKAEKQAPQPLTNAPPTLPLEKYAGRYGGKMFGDAVISYDQGKLSFKLLPNPNLAGELKPLRHDVFEIDWHSKAAWFRGGTVQFLLNRKSEPVEFTMDVPNDDFWFDELEFKKK